ncbi:MAG: GH1 family beta-glucosidase [Acidimicrobiia bacterium]
MDFAPDFAWGVASSAYQIEGAAAADGRGPSIWDRFAHTPGKIARGETGDVACDHYNRYRQDVALMADLGVTAYRFSISWSRVLPSGTGAVNAPGLGFYDRLVDELLAAGITPYPTLHHWDTPAALHDEYGGWVDRRVVDAFAYYTAIVAETLGDRVKHWITINEPRVTVQHGYQLGEFAPGHTNVAESLAVGHHLLLGHAYATQALRAAVPDAVVGISPDPNPVVAGSQASAAAASLRDGLQNRWFLDPLAGRGYPSDVVEHYGVPMDFVLDGDLEEIAMPIDFLGVNYYRREIEGASSLDPLPTTDMGWEIYPEGLTAMLLRLANEYGFKRLIVTENGAAYPDVVVDGAVDDTARVEYLAAHIAAIGDAIAQGAPVTGYFVWSVMDNFEWASGYAKRFGLIHVDFETQQRTIKKSGYWYRDFIRSQR